MAQLTNFGRNNPLWRRVQRHAQMSALFGETPMAILPAPTALPPSSLSTEVTAVAAPRAISQPGPLPVQPPTLPHSPTLATKADDDDGNWRRLQKIHQLHQRKAKPTTNAPASPVQQRMEAAASPTSDPAEPDQTEPPREVETAAPSPPPIAPTNEPHAQDSGVIADKPPSSPQSNLAQTVGEALQKVAPSQKTDSSVELLLPSRPRPQPKPAQQPPTVQRQSQLLAAAPQPAAENTAETQPSKLQPTAVPEHSPQPNIAPPQNKPTSAQPDINQGQNTAVSSPPPSAKQKAQPAPTKMVPTDIGPLPSDLWELLGEPVPPVPKPSAATPTAVPATIITPPVIQRQPEAIPTKTVDFAPSAPAAASSVVATAVTPKPPKSPARLMAKPVTNPTASLNPTIFLEETGPAEEFAAATTIVQRTSQTAPAKPTTLSQTEAASTTAVPQHSTPPAQPIRYTSPHRALNQMPLEQALQLAPMPTLQSVPPGELATPTPQPNSAPQPETQLPPTPRQQAIHQAEKPQPNVIQRFPDVGVTMGEVETAVASITPQTIAAPLTANALLEEPETETDPSSASEVDLDELARQVYQALKRKLAIERERGYGR